MYEEKDIEIQIQIEREREREGFTLRNCITESDGLISLKFAEQAIRLGILAKVNVSVLS